jgi:hypothetical protein
MANEDRNKNSNRVREMLQACIENRLGIAPYSNPYEVTNVLIAKRLSMEFEQEGIIIDNDRYAIKVVWNPKFNSEIKERKRKSEMYPFRVIFGVRLSKQEKKNRMFDGSDIVNRAMALAEQNSHDDSTKAQFHLSGNDKLNKILSRFKTKKVKFKNMGKGRYQTDLDAGLVLAFLLDLDGEASRKFRWVIDIISGPSQKEANRQVFSFKVAKTLQRQTYKKAKGGGLLDSMR